MSKKQTTKIGTLVGGNSELVGDVNFDGGLHVDGVIKGNIEAKKDQESHLILSESGCIEGDVRVKNATINGTVIGDIYADERLEMAEHAKVRGNIYYGLLEMAAGAQVNGQLLRNTEGVEFDRGREDELTEISDVLNKH